MPDQPSVDANNVMIHDRRDRLITSEQQSTRGAPRNERIEERNDSSSNIEYWTRSRHGVISIGLIDNHILSRGCIAKILVQLDETLNIFPFGSCKDCLSSDINYDIIVYHDHSCTSDQNSAAGLLQTLQELPPSSSIIILSPVDNLSLALKAFEAGARAFIPTTVTTIEMVVEIIHLVRVGGMFLPPSSMCLKRIMSEDASQKRILNQMFTPRELAVLDKLRRGKPNKIIAHELMLSQSTVKGHIRSIMEKMHVRNRTEIVSLCFSNLDMMLFYSSEGLSSI